MKRLLLSLLLVSAVSQAQIVNIPDANFKARLLAANATNGIARDADSNSMVIDTNGDNEIQQSEALGVYWLAVPESNITDLTGIEAFTNLQRLQAYNNHIVSFSTAGLGNLHSLHLGGNEITTLNVTALTQLNMLLVYDNPLTTLFFESEPTWEMFDVSDTLITSLDFGTGAITTLNCSHTLLTELDLSEMGVVEVFCNNNEQLTSITIGPIAYFLDANSNPNLVSVDLTNATGLTGLQLAGSGLTSLDVSNATALESLNISATEIASIDVSALVNLSGMQAQETQLGMIDLNSNPNLCLVNFSHNPNLTHVFMKNGPEVCGETHDFSNNPNLVYFCTDEAEVLDMVNYFGGLGMNVNVNTYCTFEPAEGSYSTISGQVRYDLGNDGCDGSDALPFPILLNLASGANGYATATGADGDYIFYLPQGDFTVTPNIENLDYFMINPTSLTLSLPVLDTHIPSMNFCIAPNGVHPDLEVVVAPLVPARPGFPARYLITYRNKGNQVMTQEYGVTFFYNENLLDFVSADTTPATAGPGALTWNYADLKPFESRSVEVTLNVNPPTDPEYPVNLDDVLILTAAVLPNAGDETTQDNLSILDQVVVGSYDPNDITCLEGETEDPAQIGEYLHYLVRFENTGTYEAENIVVKEIIDPLKYDIASLQLLGASHDVDVRIKNGIAEFIFKNIQLETGGHGNILLKIKSKPNLVVGDFVKQDANIYFDYNFPVETNDAKTTFQALSAGSASDISVAVYPNPVSDKVTLSAATDIDSVELFDVQGRLLQVATASSRETTLDMGTRSAGVYFARVRTQNGAGVVKLVKN